MAPSDIELRLRDLEKQAAAAKAKDAGDAEALSLQLEYIKGQGEHTAIVLRQVQADINNLRSVQQAQIGKLRRDLNTVDDRAKKNASNIGWMLKIGGAIQAVGLLVAGWIWGK